MTENHSRCPMQERIVMRVRYQSYKRNAGVTCVLYGLIEVK